MINVGTIPYNLFINSFVFQWCLARDLLGLENPFATRDFELGICYLQFTMPTRVNCIFGVSELLANLEY